MPLLISSRSCFSFLREYQSVNIETLYPALAKAFASFHTLGLETRC